MKNPKDIGIALSKAETLRDGESGISGLSRHTRDIILIAANAGAQEQIKSVLEHLNKILEQESPDDAYARGHRSALTALRDQIMSDIYPWQVIATAKGLPDSIIAGAHSQRHAERLAEHWNLINGHQATYTAEEA